MTPGNPPSEEVKIQVRRLNRQADDLDRVGDRVQAARFRNEAIVLAAAEAQRLNSLADAHTEAARCLEGLHYAWETIEPADSFAWFLKYSDDADVLELHEQFKRQTERILILERARV